MVGLIVYATVGLFESSKPSSHMVLLLYEKLFNLIIASLFVLPKKLMLELRKFSTTSEIKVQLQKFDLKVDTMNIFKACCLNFSGKAKYIIMVSRDQDIVSASASLSRTSWSVNEPLFLAYELNFFACWTVCRNCSVLSFITFGKHQAAAPLGRQTVSVMELVVGDFGF
ncbi:hypothetical protein CEXT_231321 [Caerostris extrusa]|uniref:Uncharacterized protein n=1 Tax=Caerostris extrusa TaxID=172846 RepID=A0AAV4VZU6_CAEEX|nr:hypothetical protein CEXT_231321 [Caerostris extrusa]